jgi:hypothetical protein
MCLDGIGHPLNDIGRHPNGIGQPLNDIGKGQSGIGTPLDGIGMVENGFRMGENGIDSQKCDVLRLPEWVLAVPESKRPPADENGDDAESTRQQTGSPLKTPESG